MINRRNLFLAAGAFLAFPVFAADQSARDFVTAIYDAYKGKDAKGHPLDDAAAIRRYFAPPLAALIVKDQNAAAKRGEVGNLDGDPFIDAQDWDIKDFDIAVAASAPDKTTATVKFNNLGTPKTVVLDLVKLKGGWRINEITWQRDGKSETLRALFRP